MFLVFNADECNPIPCLPWSKSHKLIIHEVSTNISTFQVILEKNCVFVELDMLTQGKHTDFTIVADGQELNVHKFKLMAHSAVFEAMFNHKNTKEIIVRYFEPLALLFHTRIFPS